MNNLPHQFTIYGRVARKGNVEHKTNAKGNPSLLLELDVQNESSMLRIQMRGHRFNYVFIEQNGRTCKVPYDQWRQGKILGGTRLMEKEFPDFEAISLIDRQLVNGTWVRIAGVIETVGPQRLRFVAKGIDLLREIPESMMSTLTMTIQVEQIYHNPASSDASFALTVEGTVLSGTGTSTILYTCDEKMHPLLKIGDTLRITGQIIHSLVYEQIGDIRFFSGIHRELRIMGVQPIPTSSSV